MKKKNILLLLTIALVLGIGVGFCYWITPEEKYQEMVSEDLFNSLSESEKSDFDYKNLPEKNVKKNHYDHFENPSKHVAEPVIQAPDQALSIYPERKSNINSKGYTPYYSGNTSDYASISKANENNASSEIDLISMFSQLSSAKHKNKNEYMFYGEAGNSGALLSRNSMASPAALLLGSIDPDNPDPETPQRTEPITDGWLIVLSLAILFGFFQKRRA